MTLEETASRVLAAQVAGSIALWTQLYTFEDGPPEAMVWTALFLLIVSISFLGLFLRPRRIVRYWDRAIPDELFAVRRSVSLEEEASIIEHVTTTLRRQRDWLERGIRVSVPLGITALCLTFLAYVVERRWYGP